MPWVPWIGLLQNLGSCPGISGLLRAIPSAADHNLPTLVGFCRHLSLPSWRVNQHPGSRKACRGRILKMFEGFDLSRGFHLRTSIRQALHSSTCVTCNWGFFCILRSGSVQLRDASNEEVSAADSWGSREATSLREADGLVYVLSYKKKWMA